MVVLSNKLKLTISILIPLIVGFTSSLFTMNSIPTWYQTLVKPSLNPPNWIFAPVWTLLYILIGVSLYLVWKKGFKNKKVRIGIYLFSVQLILNFLWTFLFFGLRFPSIASMEIVALWIFILLTIIKFYKVSKIAAYMLIPYILWVSFASYLSFSVFLLNI
jgi:benzodiazapine receptor